MMISRAGSGLQGMQINKLSTAPSHPPWSTDRLCPHCVGVVIDFNRELLDQDQGAFFGALCLAIGAQQAAVSKTDKNAAVECIRFVSALAARF